MPPLAALPERGELCRESRGDSEPIEVTGVHRLTAGVPQFSFLFVLFIEITEKTKETALPRQEGEDEVEKSICSFLTAQRKE